MAEKKYEMLIGPRKLNSNLNIRPQPWYRERLNKKYESSKPPLIASSWTFLKDGMDDFRDGKVPVVDCSSMIIKGSKGVRPSIFGSDSFDGQKPKQRMKKHLTKEEAVYSKSLPNQQHRKQRVDDVEKHLLDHPLALYSHIQDSMSPALFEEIVDLLDPSLTLSNEIIDEVNMRNETPLSTVLSKETSADNEDIQPSTEGMFAGYKSERLKPSTADGSEEDIRNNEKCKTNRKNKQTSQLTEIEGVTKDFCDWVRNLGGDSNNMEESTINSLFASGYDAKPTLSVPVHVVELTNVPAELRADGTTSGNEDKVKKVKETQAYTPSWVKVKYGAWYLDPKKWKARPSNEPLIDPKDIEEKQMSDSKKKSKNLDKTLCHLHGAKAFKEFVDSKGARSPEFLESVNLGDDSTSSVDGLKGSKNKQRSKKQDHV